MSAKRRSQLLAVVAILAFASVASAQHYQPFIEPGYFDHDLQFFAPADDIDAYGGDIFQRYGWFGSYDRMYLWLSRPNQEQSYTEGDMTWGNRVDLGYMVDDVDHDHGWLFSWTHIDGPNANDYRVQEAINRFNEDDEGQPPPDDTAATVVEPPIDRNTAGPPNRSRTYNVTNSINVAKVFSIEMNKLFRTPPLNHGGLLEPFFGIRYMNFEDRFQRQTYARYTDLGEPVPLPVPPIGPPVPPPDPPLLYPVDATIEDLVTDQFGWKNQMVGGQLGARWSRRLSRWSLSSEFRAFGLQNFQNLSRQFETQRTYYDGGGQGSQVSGVAWSQYQSPGARQSWHATSFVPGTDIRAEAAYDVTRDIQLHVGLQFLGLFNGIGRGPNIDYNSQDVILFGTSFGFIVNR